MRWKLQVLSLCMGFSLLVLSPAWATEPASMPETFFADEREQHPSWVSAGRVLTPTGEVDASLFPASFPEQLRYLLNLPEKDGCLPLREVLISRIDPPVREDISQAARTAGVVMLAQVTGLSPGFRLTEAGHLVRIRPAEVLKGKEKVTLDEYYFFIPVGSFTVGEKRLCKIDQRYVSLPEVGQEVLLFAFGPATKPYLDIRDDGGIVVLRGDSFALPERYKSDPLIQGKSRDKLLEIIRRLTDSEVQASKPVWQWTIEERLAKRFDPAEMKARAAAEDRRLQELVDLGMLEAEELSIQTRSAINGRENPELFVPWELFNTLLLRGFPPDGHHQAESRRSIDELAVALGFGADLWQRLGRLASPYLELRRERDRLGIAHRQGAPGDQRLETTLSIENLCRARVEALIKAKREFGEESFMRLLYEAVAPSLLLGSGAEAH